MTSVGTINGKLVSLVDPDPATIDIEDIAHHLALQCRFNGAVAQLYSVAQHSVLVARAVSDLGPRMQLAALLHDAQEAYLGDIVSPVKHLLGRHWESIEERMQRAIFERFGIADQLPLDAAIKVADKRVLATEERDLRDRLAHARQAHGSAYEPLFEQIEPWAAVIAASRFLALFDRLLSEIPGQ